MESNKKVWRFTLLDAENPESFTEPLTEVEISMPVGSELIGQPTLSVKGVVIYALVPTTDVGEVTRTFVVVGNDVELPDDVGSINYRGTFKVPGSITRHFFETTAVTASA